MTKEEAIKYIQQLYPNGGHCRLDEQRIEAIGMAVKALQEEPVSESLEKAATKYAQNEYIPVQTSQAFKAGANWHKEQMMAEAIDAQCFGFQGTALFSFRLPVYNYLIGSEVKVIVIKEK